MAYSLFFFIIKTREKMFTVEGNIEKNGTIDKPIIINPETHEFKRDYRTARDKRVESERPWYTSEEE